VLPALADPLCSWHLERVVANSRQQARDQNPTPRPGRRRAVVLGVAICLVLLAVVIVATVQLQKSPPEGYAPAACQGVLPTKFAPPGRIVRLDARFEPSCDGKPNREYRNWGAGDFELAIFPRRGVQTRRTAPGVFEVAAPLGRYH